MCTTPASLAGSWLGSKFGLLDVVQQQQQQRAEWQQYKSDALTLDVGHLVSAMLVYQIIWYIGLQMTPVLCWFRQGLCAAGQLRCCMKLVVTVLVTL